MNQTNKIEEYQEIVKTIEPNNIEIKNKVSQFVKETKSIKQENKKSIIQQIEQKITKSESAEEYSSDFVIVNVQPV